MIDDNFSMKRRLAADIAGYSRLMGEDEAVTVNADILYVDGGSHFGRW